MNEQTANILACFFASGVCLEGIVHPKIKKSSHYLLTLLIFKICMTFFLMRRRNLKIVG